MMNRFQALELLEWGEKQNPGPWRAHSLTAARAAGHSLEDALALANRVAGAVCGVEGSTLTDEAFARTGARL